MKLTEQEVRELVELATTQIVGDRQEVTAAEMQQVILLVVQMLSECHNETKN